jgi:hypothetical protein
MYVVIFALENFIDRHVILLLFYFYYKDCQILKKTTKEWVVEWLRLKSYDNKPNTDIDSHPTIHFSIVKTSYTETWPGISPVNLFYLLKGFIPQ